MAVEAARRDWALEIDDLRKSFTLHHHGAASLKVAVVKALRRREVEIREVLHGLTLRVGRGETVALVGRNGSGKSTLLSIVAGVYRPSSGTALAHGTIAPLLELGAGFHPDLTGVENAEMYGAILGMTRATVRERLDSIVQFAFDTPDLLNKIDTPIRNYSDGMKMRLGFSVAIHTDPDILIVDEVLAVGDEAFQHKCYRKIAELQRAGKTILFVSHDIRVIRQVAQRVVWLHHGAVRMDGDVATVLTAYMEAADLPDFGQAGDA